MPSARCRQTGGIAMETVVFIHDAWTTPRCWRYFVSLFAEKGYRTLAPAWQFKDRVPGDQLADPDPRLAKVGISLSFWPWRPGRGKV
jgi:hypothetical protein